MLRVKSRATSQVTFDADYNVPDVKPDIGRMIQNKGEVEVEEVRLNDGHAFVRGSLNVDLLYVGEEEGRVYSLSAKLPVEETLNLEGIVSGDKMCLKWEIEDQAEGASCHGQRNLWHRLQYSDRSRRNQPCPYASLSGRRRICKKSSTTSGTAPYCSERRPVCHHSAAFLLLYAHRRLPSCLRTSEAGN